MFAVSVTGQWPASMPASCEWFAVTGPLVTVAAFGDQQGKVQWWHGVDDLSQLTP